MLAVDSETTGLWFKHGCTTFALGAYDGIKQYNAIERIDPLTRRKQHPWRQGTINNIRKAFDNADIVVMHNSGFDLKALVEMGVIEEHEPDVPEFWEKILDTTLLAHLHNNIDDSGLKKLVPKYLGVEYESDDILGELVCKCRLFVKSRRPDWKRAVKGIPELKPASSSNTWWKGDLWLPYEVALSFPARELTDYGFDIEQLKSVLKDYLADDCKNTYYLAEALLHEVLNAHGEDVVTYLKTNTQIQNVIWKMENTGTPVHMIELNNAIDACVSNMKELEKTLSSISGVDKLTPKKLAKVLYEDFELPVLKQTKKGADSTDADTIIKLKYYCEEHQLTEANTFLSYHLAHSKYDKKLGYLTSYKNCTIDNVVYPTYKIVGTSTMRMSATNPSPHTVAKASNPFEDSFEDVARLLDQSPPLRSVFGPHTGRWWLCNDYSQLQLRIFAVVTNEQPMIEAFNKGWDAHDYTARRIFYLKDDETPSSGQRRIAKNVNFGFIFGASPKKIESTAGQPGLWSVVCEMFPNAHDFIQQQKDLIRMGEPVRTIGGYPLDVPTRFNHWKGTHESAAHAAVCYIVQGSEGEIVKRAMRKCDDYLVSNFPAGRLVMQVHDEISFDMPAKFPETHARALKTCMEEAALQFGVHAPVNCEITTKLWNECKKVSL